MIEESYDFPTSLYHVTYEATPGGKSILYYKQENYENGFILELNPKD